MVSQIWEISLWFWSNTSSPLVAWAARPFGSSGELSYSANSGVLKSVTKVLEFENAIIIWVSSIPTTPALWKDIWKYIDMAYIWYFIVYSLVLHCMVLYQFVPFIWYLICNTCFHTYIYTIEVILSDWHGTGAGPSETLNKLRIYIDSISQSCGAKKSLRFETHQGWAGIPVSRDSREYTPQISHPFPSRGIL